MQITGNRTRTYVYLTLFYAKISYKEARKGCFKIYYHYGLFFFSRNLTFSSVPVGKAIQPKTKTLDHISTQNPHYLL